MTELLSTAATRQATVQHSDDPFLLLLTLSHAQLETPIRIVRSRQDIVSRGNTFTAYPFDIGIPTDTSDTPSAQITVANVSRQIGRTLENLIEPPTALIELVLASTPDDVERAWSPLDMTDCAWDAFSVTATLQQQAFWDEPWPKVFIRPNNFPGLFA